MRIMAHDDRADRQANPRSLSELLRICACSVRVELLFALADGERDVSVLAESIELDITLVSHHLKPLRQAGFVRARRHQRRRAYTLGESIVVDRREGRLSLTLHAIDGTRVAIELPLSSRVIRPAPAPQVVAAPARMGSAR